MFALHKFALARHLNHQLLLICSQIIIAAILICIGISSDVRSLVASEALPPISQILQDIADDGSCNEFHKDCHCGSIAQGPGSSLFTRIVYPNSTTVIEEYDEDVPYGYKYLRVYYRCTDEENVLVGNNMRECSNGNWQGQVPRCGKLSVLCHCKVILTPFQTQPTTCATRLK